jgi:hypothetical protein
LNTFAPQGSVTVTSGKIGQKRLLEPNIINKIYTEEIFEPINNVAIFDDEQILDLNTMKLHIVIGVRVKLTYNLILL